MSNHPRIPHLLPPHAARSRPAMGLPQRAGQDRQDGGMQGGRRFLALHLPLLPIDRLRRAGHTAETPLATWQQEGNRRLIAASDAPGVFAGQTMADAQAIHPLLRLVPADDAADAAALNALALWARRWSPLTATQPPDGVVLDITGSAHLFGGEAAMLGDALRRLARQGLRAQGAVAGNPVAAGALARVDAGAVPPQAEPRLLARLPLKPALRLPVVTLGELNRLGLRLLGDLLAQPRAPLGRRFGPALLARLEALTGALPASISPVVPPPEFWAARDMLDPVITREGIDMVLDHLLAELCERLAAAGHGARQLMLLAWRCDGSMQQVGIGLGRASRQPGHLRRLFHEPLGTLEPRLGFERMALEAGVTEPLSDVQVSLDGKNAGELAQLLDRLEQRLWVRRVAARPSHWPEHSVATVPAHDAPPAMPAGWAAPEKPVLLLRRPRLVTVVNALPDGPPLMFGLAAPPVRGDDVAVPGDAPASPPLATPPEQAPAAATGATQAGGPAGQSRVSLVTLPDGSAGAPAVGRTDRPQRLRPVRQAIGPLRLEAEWWRHGNAAQGAIARDYWRVELEGGTRLWLYREGGNRWLLHGRLP